MPQTCPANNPVLRRLQTAQNCLLFVRRGCCTVIPMLRLTRQERKVLTLALLLLLAGWAVKSFRSAHPPAGTPAPLNTQSDAYGPF